MLVFVWYKHVGKYMYIDFYFIYVSKYECAQ